MTATPHADGRLAGRRAFVTGAGGGLGIEIAAALGREGASVTLAGRTPERVEAAAKRAGPNARPVTLDVRDAAAVERAVVEAHGNMGGLDVVVNAAAIDTGWAPSADMALDVWDDTIAINLSGTYYVCRAAL